MKLWIVLFFAWPSLHRNRTCCAWTPHSRTRRQHDDRPPKKSASSIQAAVPVSEIPVVTHTEALPASLSASPSASSLPTSAWEVLAGNMAQCLVASDLKRDSGFDGSSTGWTSWVDGASALRLQSCIDRLVFSDGTTAAAACSDGFDDDALSGPFAAAAAAASSKQRDGTVRWLRWMKACPAPMIIGFDDDLRGVVGGMLTRQDYDRIEQTPPEFLSRIACRVILLPSGGTLRDNLRTPPGAMVYGKLLYGGVTRFRILGNAVHGRPTRKVGERTVMAPSSAAASTRTPTEGWLQYGGPERNYEAVDVGPCALMEITILPKGLSLPTFGGQQGRSGSDNVTTSAAASAAATAAAASETQEMVATRATTCDLRWMFEFPPEPVTAENASTTSISGGGDAPDTIDGNQYSLHEIESNFSTVLGGLRTEIRSIVRRVLDGRVHPSGAPSRAEEVRALLDLGLSPIRGLLLYGKPGCGKTALAREISRLLTERPPKIVSAPELLDRWVGGSEKLVRELFKDAEAELAMCNGDVAKSGIHVVVIDEIDAVFRTRSSSSGSGEVARASAVNQILAKMDGVNSIGNVLVIGTTNRRDLLDEALLRPGRLEVQIEVPLPDLEGRREILRIYFGPLRRNGRLSQPLCAAIDGAGRAGDTTRWHSSSSSSFRRRVTSLISWKADLHSSISSTRMIHDLAADRWTGGFSGADLEGLVRCAASHALHRARQDGNGVDGLLVTMEDVLKALQEVKQQ